MLDLSCWRSFTLFSHKRLQDAKRGIVSKSKYYLKYIKNSLYELLRYINTISRRRLRREIRKKPKKNLAAISIKAKLMAEIVKPSFCGGFVHKTRIPKKELI
jgi:hypothetical protein